MTARHRNRLLGLAGLAVGAGVLVVVALGGIEGSLVYYWTPQQLLAKGREAETAIIRLGGMVMRDSVRWDPNTLELEFLAGERLGHARSADAVVRVRAHGAPPPMFREGMGVVVEGRYDGEIFWADRVLVKHSNAYRPPGEGAPAKKIFDTLVTDAQDAE